jgi:hypothetical protein
MSETKTIRRALMIEAWRENALLDMARFSPDSTKPEAQLMQDYRQRLKRSRICATDVEGGEAAWLRRPPEERISLVQEVWREPLESIRGTIQFARYWRAINEQDHRELNQKAKA